MTRIRQITLALLASTLAVAPLAATAAKQSMFNAHLSGNEVIPARATNATGQAKFVSTPDEASLNFRVNVSNIQNVVAAELRQGPAGSDGPVVATIYGPVAAGGGKQTGVLSEGSITASNLSGPLAGQPLSALIDAMRSGTIYVLVRTDDGQGAPDQKPGDFSTGEIRGQVK